MQECTNIDCWTIPCDALCIPTNGSLVRLGPKGGYRGVMGRGVAKQARDRDPGLDVSLGDHVRTQGHVVGVIRRGDVVHCTWVSFPVKHRWQESADLDLIRTSARELMALIAAEAWTTVVLPRPGCGNGRLAWEFVRPALIDVLDDRVVVVTNEAG